MKPSLQLILGLVLGALVATLIVFGLQGGFGPAHAPTPTVTLDAQAPEAFAAAWIEAERVGEGPEVVQTAQADSKAEGDPEIADRDAGIGLRWSYKPSNLQVYRSTAIHFRLDHSPKDHPAASCSWKFGDGGAIEEGCAISHTFHGGVADQFVTLTLTDGDWNWASTRSIPLERLEVVTGLGAPGAPRSSALPEAPAAGPTSFRLAIVADSAASGGVSDAVSVASKALVGPLAADLVIHAGGIVAEGADAESWGAVDRAFAAPLQDDDVAVLWGLSPTDRRQKPKLTPPTVQMVDGAHFPERYSFTFKGAFFLVISADDKEGLGEEVLEWMRAQLASARVYEARFVVSYLPLHKFGDAHLGSLDKKFRLYELFLRGRVTTLFSAGYRVYFKGRYGALPVVSVGALAAPGGRLAGHDFAQPPSLTLMDIAGGVPERVLAVEGPEFTRALDEELLPEAVEVYTR